MDKAELKVNAEKALNQWLDQVFCDECSDMEEFSFSIEVRRCACGRVRRIEVLQECRPAWRCEDDEDLETGEGCTEDEQETEGEPR